MRASTWRGRWHLAIAASGSSISRPGQQPIANETGTVQVILNGEIYNFAEVRTRLQEKGHRFKTRSDTEVIVHAYEEFGEECVAHFNGMFAFALWDEERESLFLARDRMGEKPLYYTEQAGWFIFGSEAQSGPRTSRGGAPAGPPGLFALSHQWLPARSPHDLPRKSTSCRLDTSCPSRQGKLVSFATGTFSSSRIASSARMNGRGSCGTGCVSPSGDGS